MLFRKLAAALLFLALAAPAAAQETLVIYFSKGFYPQEDKALDDVIAKFQKKTGVKVELSRYAPQEMIPKTVAALDAGNPPDIVYADVFDFQVAGKWAFEGRLEDVSDIINPIKGKFLPNTIETTFMYNDKTKKRAYYAFPVKRQTMHIQYWKDMLADAGFKESDIPKTWKAYFDFWCSKVQEGYRKKTGKRVYSVGSPMGVDSSDSFYSFLTYMDGYNVKLVNDDGKLNLGKETREGLINAVRDYTETIGKGCTPPSAINWKDPDNNVNFHNKTIIMTHNATISIAAKWLDDMNNDKLKPEERAAAKKNYEELIATVGLPEQARRQADAVPRRGQGRRRLQQRQEQEARQGVRRFPDGRREPDAVRRGCARPLVPGDEGRGGGASSGPKTRTARWCTTSSRPAR